VTGAPESGSYSNHYPSVVTSEPQTWSRCVGMNNKGS